MIYMNRNTSPISPLSHQQIMKVIETTQVHQYPEEELARFKKLYSQYSGYDPDFIELANGSDEWLQKLMIQFGQRGVLALKPSFFMYQDYAQQMGREFWQVEADDAFNFDLGKVLDAIKAKRPSLMIVSNPQNPTGHQFPAEFLQALADALEAIGGYFVIDEAYIEFGDDYRRPQNPNVIIVRTLSKIFGMAGMRMGIATAQGETYRRLTAINHPYPVNNLCLNLANEFFEDQASCKEFMAYQIQSRDRLVETFNEVADVVDMKPTKANFILTYGSAAMSLADFLMEKGYAPRTYAAEIAQACVRYSIIQLEDYSDLQTAILEWRNLYDK